MTSSSLCTTSYRLNLRCGVWWVDIEVLVTCKRGRSLIRINEQSTPSLYGKAQRHILDLNDAHVYQSIYYIQLRSAKNDFGDLINGFKWPCSDEGPDSTTAHISANSQTRMCSVRSSSALRTFARYRRASQSSYLVRVILTLQLPCLRSDLNTKCPASFLPS
jgi:hypothetical protein